MKKKFILVLVIAIIAFTACVSLVGCANTEHTLTFDTNGGGTIAAISISKDTELNLPVPSKENHTFEGWFYDNNTFASAVTIDNLKEKLKDNDVTIYAKWKVVEDGKEEEIPAPTIELTAVQNDKKVPVINVTFELEKIDKQVYSDIKLDFKYKNNLLKSVTITNNSEVEQKVVFGNIDIILTAKNNKNATIELAKHKIGVYSNEYNMTSSNGSYPVLNFTLELFSRTGTSKQNFEANGMPVMTDAPTFVALQRAWSYNWDQLPENVYPFPNLPYNEVVQGEFFHQHNVLIPEYIKELYEINKESKFNFYCVDNYPELILKFFEAQKITNYKAYLITDGVGTITYYQKAFAKENAKTEYDKMVAEWKRIKTAAQNGDPNYLKNVYNGEDTFSILAQYPLVMSSVESNIEWWCTRKDLFTNNTQSQFIKDIVEGTNVSGENEKEIQANIKYPNIGKMLSSLSQEDSQGLKKLYRFDDETFKDAYDNNKKILVILGTTNDTERLKSYTAIMNAMYGEEYQIYYKGHPQEPTDLKPDKKKVLEDANITDINAAIAAELFLFYCPDINLVGFQSTTFRSAEADKILALFDQSKESWCDIPLPEGSTPAQKHEYVAQNYIKLSTTEENVYNIQDADGNIYAKFNTVTKQLTYVNEDAE